MPMFERAVYREGELISCLPAYVPLTDSVITPYRRVLAKLERGGIDHIYASLPEPLRTRNLKRPPPRLRPRRAYHTETVLQAVDRV